LLGPLLASSACTRVELPPVSAAPTGAHLTGKFIWRDLLTDDVAAARRFYGDLFGWQFEDVAEGQYVLITHGGTPIGGIVAADVKIDVDVSQWVSWLSVRDVDAAAHLVQDAGGAVLRGPMNLSGRGRLVVVTDPQGALLVLVRTADGDPEDREPGEGDWLWTELWTHEPEVSMGFYGRLVGYERETVDLGDGTAYTVLAGSGARRAGVVDNPFERVATNWLPYVRVADASATAERAAALGGQVLLEPRADVRSGTAAIIADPTGAAFTVQKWPLD
jgi:hypothetical protein